MVVARMRREPEVVTDILYDKSMKNVKQIAFQIDNDELDDLDSHVGDEFRSRAAVIRAAVHEWLKQKRREKVDLLYAQEYARAPETPDEAAFADVSVEALESADLDW